MARFQRYMLTRQRHDLDLSILRSTEAIFLPPPWGGAPPNIIQIFFSISLTLFHRARESRRPKDVKHSVMYLRFLHNQPLESFNVPPDLVTEVFVHALAIQVELDLGQTQDIEEMAVLCLELLDSDISITPSTDSIMALFRAIKAQFVRWDGLREPPKKAIECLREANRRLPDSHQLSIALACVLFNRFNITYSNDDYEEATAILDKVIASSPPGGQFQVIALHMVAFLAQARSAFDGKPVNVEHAIYRIRTLLGGPSVEELFRPGLIQELARLQAIRFDDSGGIDGIQDANSCNLEYSCRPSFRDLTESLAEPNGVRSLPITAERQHLEALLSTPRFTNVTDIVEAIEYCRVWLTSYPHSGLATLAGITLCLLLLRAFSYTDKMDYLNEAISVLQDHLINPGVGRCRFMVVGLFISSVTIRFNRLYRKEDFNELMELFPVAVNDRRGRTPERFTRSCEWARTARFFGHPSASTAYDCAVSLIQDTLTFAPTLEIQHSRLVAMRHSYETLPLDSASYLVHMGRLPEAIETLERGRALLWSEMRGLRTSIDQIRAVDLHIADKFTAINRNLEMLILTALPDGNGGEVGSFEEMEPFGRLVVEQQKLLDDRDKIISQLRTLPSFENFLKASPFDSLRSAAARGPVIIINHCIWRSDILILIHDSPSCLIHTSNDFYSRANKLRDRLLDARKKGLDSDEYEVALRVVLEELYELVGRPVIQRLSELNVPEQSRVWWCPTSAFCSLPLHAMGPIPSDDGAPRYFLDLYIPSYTPTLSALIESNKHGSKMLEKPSILLVLQPDASMEQALEEMQVVQSVNTRVTTLISATATPPAVLERLRDHRFAHIVCHGILEPGKPFDASFKLYRDKRLSLLDIVRSRLPDAEFAFLAACHTAELTDKSLADEALHLTAAMQYCGFRSVVGTMWAMADTDGQHLARNFYKSVFSGKKQGVRYYEKTARALRDAVVKLRSQRGRGMTLERWVNFVHYGA